MMAKISPATLAKLSKDEFVSLDVLVRICELLECNIGDIVDVTKLISFLEIVFCLSTPLPAPLD